MALCGGVVVIGFVGGAEPAADVVEEFEDVGGSVEVFAAFDAVG